MCSDILRTWIDLSYREIACESTMQEKELKAQSANMFVKYTSRVILLYFLVLYKGIRDRDVLSAIKIDNRHISFSLSVCVRCVSFASHREYSGPFALRIKSTSQSSSFWSFRFRDRLPHTRRKMSFDANSMYTQCSIRSGEGPSFSTVFLFRRRDAFCREGSSH